MELSQVERCKKWAAEYVVGLDLCPFARGPLEREEVEWLVLADLGRLDSEIERFIKSGTRSVFFILNASSDFSYYLEIVDLVESVLNVLGYADDLKIVTFHPHHQYEGTDEDDEVNFANRAPSAMIQLLRTADLAKLGMTAEWKNEILSKNSSKLEELGTEKLKEMLDEYRG